jgi:hypothetical protein
LKETGLSPPYLLAAHSFGGILLRTFLQLQLPNLSGLLLLDTATELMLSPLFPHVPPLALTSIARNVDVESLMHLQRDSGMSSEEWDYAIAASTRCAHALSLEDTHASAYALSLHRQLDFQVLGHRPLTVVQCNTVRDFQMLYDEGVRLGDGSEEEREAARGFIERWGALHGQIARAQRGLGKDVLFRYFGEWGHDLPVRRPGVVVEEVRGLLSRMGFEGGERRSLGWGVVGNVERKEATGLSPAMSFLG